MTSQTTLTGDLIIGGERVRGGGGEFQSVNPRTGDSLQPSYGLGTETDVRRAALLARDAFESYRATGNEERAAFLDSIADNLDSITETLVTVVIEETGIVEPRVRGELTRTSNQLRLFAEVVRDGNYVGARVDPALPDRKPRPRPDIRQRKIPVGPVVVFGASNFPLAFSVAGGDTASALAAGCPVIVKAHSAHPRTSELVGLEIQRAVAENGLHEGVFSLLFGSGREVGIGLVTHPAVSAVGFTGSRSGGVALMAAAAARPVPIPVYAEMSSTNPVFLLPGALEARGEAIGREFVESLTTGVGQLCTNPGVIFAVDGAGLDRFLQEATEAVARSAALPMLNTSICAAYHGGIESLRTLDGVDEVSSGAGDDTIVTAGSTHLFATTGEAFLAEPKMREEVFGATSLIVRLKGVDEVDRIVESLEGQLTATIHADESDFDLARTLVARLETRVGRILFNDWPTGVEVGHAMVHGGPYPATADGRSTSVGTLAIDRFLRPVAYQNVPPTLLPAAIDTTNSLQIHRMVDGEIALR